ncbi:MAG TPA: hypothetical protein VGO35_01115 [Gammaproteobacteria bacterium]|nr:hypothetical protein [Gammaproteobacteria bacterium]
MLAANQKMRQLVVSFLFVFVAGCSTVPDVHRFGQVDLSDKSITVPAGGAGVLGEVKDELQKAGWRLVIYDGPEQIQGSAGLDTHLLVSQTYTTRYTLFMRSHTQGPGNCPWTTVSYWLDSSIVDNKSGHEVLTITGSVCSPEDAGQTLLDELNKRQ